MALTRTPRPATSTPRERVKCSTAALKAEYTGSCGYPRTPSIELTLTMAPLPCSSMAGRKAWVTEKMWRKLIS